MTDSPLLLEVIDLTVELTIPEGKIKPVDGVNFSINRGRTLGIVGESGCGKSVTALSILGLMASGAGQTTEGNIRFKSDDLLSLEPSAMRRLRGNRISMIFQEPMTSLNPVFTVGAQVAEVFQIHQGVSKKISMERAIEMLKLVGIQAANERAQAYPHELSGGMRQRIMIAMALAMKPDLLIADEPTTALDVTIQAQIMGLVKGLQESMGMSLLLITHDLGVVAETCDDVAVMYAGVIVEKAKVQQIFQNPKHPYTIGLLNSVPNSGAKTSRLKTIPGLVPDLLHLPNGCRFQERCDRVIEVCKSQEPPLIEIAPGHSVRCYNPGRLAND